MRAAFLCVAGAVTLGCATAGTIPQQGQSRDVVQTENGDMLRTTPDYAQTDYVVEPVDEAYANLLLAYQKLGIEATTNDPVGHHVGNTSVALLHQFNHQSLSSFFECGRDGFGTPRADRYRIVVSVVSSLAADGANGTKVETMVTARGIDSGGTGTDVYCSTTGHLEALLIKMARPA